MSKRKTVLVGDTENAVKMIERLLFNKARIIGTNNLATATTLLNKDLDLIVCAMHFDSSLMFDLLKIVKANPETRDIPFLCFRFSESALNQNSFDAVNTACKSMGAAGFADFLSFKVKYGNEEAEKQLQSLLIDLMTPGFCREIF